MIVYSRLYKLLATIISISLITSLFPIPVLGLLPGASDSHTVNSGVELPLNTASSNSEISTIISALPTEFIEGQLTDTKASPNSMLISNSSLQALTNRRVQGFPALPPLSVSRTQSAYTAVSAISNTLIVTFTVTNNLLPSIDPDIDPDATITETLDAVLSVDYDKDSNTLHNISLTDSLLPAQATFVSAFPQPDHDNNTFAWNLGDIRPLDSVSVTLKLNIPANANLSDFVELDTGAAVWATLQGHEIFAHTNPVLLAPDNYEGWLVCTIDADCNDKYIIEKAAELGNDPVAIFEFVRSLDYESYKGSLRGARGTLWSNAGNSMDQASLLIALLRASGIPSAYRSGTLDTALAQNLIDSMFVEPPGVLGHIPEGIATADPLNDQQLLTETKEHWWVETYLPGSGWQHMDPSFTNASIGEFFVASPGPRLAEVPDASRHKVTVRVKIEAYHPLNFGGVATGLSEFYPIIYTFNAVELVGKPVTLGHTLNTQSQGGLFFYYVQHTYTPYLAVEDLGYTIEGHTFQDLFSNFPFGTFTTTGEWLLFEIRDPEGDSETYTIEVKDKLGFEARQSGGTVQIDSQDTSPLVSEHDLITFNVAGYKDVPQKVLLSQFEYLRQLAPTVEAMQNDLTLAGEDNAEVQAIFQKHNGEIINARMGLGHTLAEYFLTTARWGRDYFSDRLLVRSYPATPKIVVVSQTESSGELAYDLIHTQERVLAHPGQAAYVEEMFQMLSGSLDTTAENLLLTTIFDAPPTSAQTILQAARDANIELVMITKENLHTLADLAISGEAKARITNAANQGKTVAVPSRMVEFNNNLTIAWLEIDASGYTIGVGENGQHQALTELGYWIEKWEAGFVTVTAARVGGFVATILLAVKNIPTARGLKVIGGTATIWIFLKGTGNPVLKAISDKLAADLLAGTLFLLTAKDVLNAPYLCSINLANPACQGAIAGLATLAIALGLYVAYQASNDPPVFLYYVAADRNTNAYTNSQTTTITVPANLSSDQILSTMLVPYYGVEGEGTDRWVCTANCSLEFNDLQTTSLIAIYDSNQTPIIGSVVDASPISEGSSIVTSGANGVNYTVERAGNASYYAAALNNVAAGATWDWYTATITATQPYTLNLHTAVITVDATDIYTGDFTLVVDGPTIISGQGSTGVPNFADDVSTQIVDSLLQFDSATLLTGTLPLDTDNGFALIDYTGAITVSPYSSELDFVELNGSASHLLSLSLNPTLSTIESGSSANFDALVSTNVSGVYSITVDGPEQWDVMIDGTGTITTTAPLETKPGNYSVSVTTYSNSTPPLFATAVHTVTVIPLQGMRLNVEKEQNVTIPLGNSITSSLIPGDTNNGQMQLTNAAFRVDITNTSTVSHTFEVEVLGIAADWLTFDGTPGQTITNITLPAGSVGYLGLYISPSLPLSTPGTSYPFNVTATAVDNPSLTQSDSDVFTIPAIAFNYVTAVPNQIYVTPNTPAAFDLSVQNVGNAAGNFPITVTMPVTTWTSTYANGTGSLAAGAIHDQMVIFTPVGAVAGDNKTIRIDSPAPGTAYTQSTFVQVAVRSPETVCAFTALQEVPDNDPGLMAALNNLLTQLELWTDLSDLTQRDQTVTAVQDITAQLQFYPGLSVTTQLNNIAAQMSGHTDPVDLTSDRSALGDILCQDLQPALTLLAAYNPSLFAFPTVLATVPGRTVTTTLTAINYGDSPATAEFSPADIPAGWDVTPPEQVNLQPGTAQQLALPITPSVLGTDTFSITMRLAEAPSLAITRTVTVRVVSELLSITGVSLDPNFLNVGTGTTDVSISLANIAGLRTAATANVQLTDGVGTVRETLVTPFTVAVNNSGPFLLGSLDIDGLEEGVYTTTVRLLDLNGSLIPNAMGYTHLAIGQDLQVIYNHTPSIVAPGQPGISVTTVITTERTDVLTSTVPFTPTLKWNFVPGDSYNQVLSPPTVGDINLDGVPDIVFSTFTGGNYLGNGILRVISGDDGSEIFSVTNTSWRVMPLASPLIVDLENDGVPEIVIERDAGGLFAFDNTGVLKYNSSAVYAPNPIFGSAPVVADLDKDGLPEIVVGRYILNNTLSQVTTLPDVDTTLFMGVVGDVNQDGETEIIYGNTVFSRTGTILAQNASVPDGYVALGNFNSDPYAEIVLVDGPGGRIYLLDHQMNIIWGPFSIPRSIGGGVAFANGGPPTVADFDGDGFPEIGVAGDSNYLVFDTDGSTLWSRPTHDYSSGATGSSVFDFQGDGKAEVVYADEQYLRVYDGMDGTVLFQAPHSSGTSFELPVIADVDADGHAEIVVAANNYYVGSYTGIRVFEAVGDNWVNTRRIWHQQAYDITSVNDNLQVVTNPIPVWLLYNTYRSQAPTPVQGNAYFVDVQHYLPLNGDSLLTDTIAPLPLAATNTQIHWLYDQQDREAFKLSQLSQLLTPALQPGEARPISTGTVISYTLNNNNTVLTIPPLYVTAPHIITITPDEVVASPGDTAVYTVTLTNAFSTTQTINLDVLGVSNTWVPLADSVTLSSGETAQLPLTVTVPLDADPLDYTVMAQALLVGGGEDMASAVLSVREGPQLSVSPALQFVAYGETVMYTLTLTNTTSRAEQYTFATDGLGGLPVGLPAGINLLPGESVTDVLTVTAQTQESTIPFLVQANGDSGLSAADEAGLGLLNGPGVKAMLSPATAIAGRGSPAIYTLTVTNTGSIEDTYTFSVDLPVGWTYELLANGTPLSMLTLTPHVFNAASLQLLVTPDVTTAPTLYPVQAHVISQSDPNTSAVAGAQAQVVSQGVQVSIAPQNVTMDPTGSQTWNVTVTNTGEAADNFTLSAAGIVSATAQFSPGTVALGPGASTVVQLSAGNLDFALPTTYPFGVTARSTGNPNVFNFDDAEVTFNGFEAVSVSITPILKVVDGFVSDHQFLMVITNTGNISTLYDLSASISPLGAALPEIDSVYIPPHMAAAVLIDVSVGSAGTYLITVQADSPSSTATDSSTATLTINAINAPPDAVDDSITTPEDTTATIHVLANDIDADGQPLSVTAVTTPANGSAVINPDNTVTYTPDPNFNGSDSFNYTIADGVDGTDTALVTVTVTAVNDNPVAVDDSAATPEDTAVTINVLLNDSDVDGDALTVTAVTTPTHGVAAINPDNTIIYTPDVDFNGSDSFSYTISDSNGGTDTATVTISVMTGNDNPVAVDDSATTPEDTAVTLTVLANDSDGDGDTLTVTAVTTPTHGTTSINPDNTVTYTPDANYNGGDSFGYTISDGNGGLDTATVTLTVTPVNDNPVAGDDSATTLEDTAVTITVLANDTDVDSVTLTVNSVTQPGNGTVVINPDGTLTYTPEPDFNSTDSVDGADTFNYVVSDGAGGSDTGMVTVTVTPVNDDPAAVGDTAVTAEDMPVTITVLANDADVDGDTITVTAVTPPANGTAVINPDNTVTYTPALNFNGSDTFNYTVGDDNSGSDTAVVTVTVTPVNDDPTASNDSDTTPEDTAVTINILTNDSDVDGDVLTVTGVTTPTHGITTLNPDNTVTYTPDADFNGSDNFSYTTSDGNGGTGTAIVTLTVTPVNDVPTANGDNTLTVEDTAVTINVLGNDTDIDGDTLVVASVVQPANGTVTNNGNNVTYTPNANFNGSDSFSYTASDGNGGADTANVTVTVNPVNDAPVAANDSATTPEDTAVTIIVLANDNDVDGDALDVVAATTPDHGTVVINPDNTIDYTPNANFNGSDNFNYTVNDGHGGSDTASVVITVTPANDAPTAVADNAATLEDTAVTIGVLDNDADLDGDMLTVSSVTQPANGIVTNNSSDVTYTPDANFNDNDSFSYTVSDGNGGTATANVNVTVAPVNDAPVAADDNAATPEDTAVTIEVLANDTDVDGDTLTVTAVTTPTHGTVVINPGSTVSYSPNANFNGTDSFNYTVSDGNGGTDTATVTIAVTSENDNPVAASDSTTTPEDMAVTLNVLANDSDVEGDALTVTAVTAPANGTAVINPDDTVTYTPDVNFNGTDSFSYTLSDVSGGTDTAVVTITVTPVNDNPAAGNDSATTPEDMAATIEVLANDSDEDGDALEVTAITTPANGTAVINPDDTITYTPDANFNGPVSFSYTVSDGNGGSDTAVVFISVTPVNDDPVAHDDAVGAVEDTVVAIDVLANDTDVDGDTLAVSAVTTPTHGAAVINSNNTVTYTPDNGYNGLDSFGYTVSDGNGGTDTAVVTVTVTAENDNPVAAEDSATTLEDTAVTIEVLTNDSDVDGDALTVTAVTTPTHGTAVINPDDTVTYTPDVNYNGSDSFSYTVSDGNGGSDTAVVTITVTAVNDEPMAVNDAATTLEDTAVTLNVLANDSDVDGDTLAVTTVTAPANGTAVVNLDDSVTYMPDADFNGSDNFSYTVSDGNGGNDTAIVTITVTAVNDAPAANNDAATTPEDTAVNVDVLTNDTDVDGDTLTTTAVTTPTNGLAVINPDNTITYTPGANFNGSDSFSYTINDDNGGSDTALVTIIVTAVNDPPAASDDAATTSEDTAVTINALDNDNDVDGDALTVTAVTTPTHGLIVINPDNTITYTPDANYNGAASFNYTVDDGQGGSDVGTVSITVTPVNDLPAADDDTVTTPEDTAITIDVLANDSDVDGDTLTVTAVTTPTNGTAVINPNNTITYTPNANYNGTDSFSYTVDDGQGGSDTASVTLIITTGNDDPTAVHDTATVLEDAAVTIDVLANDGDVDGDALSVAAVTNPAHGTAVINADNTITYTPDANYNGTDSFNYTVDDGQGGSDMASIIVTVTPVNDDPVAANDSVTSSEDTAVTVDLLANDSDVDGDVLTITAVTAPAHGSAVINSGDTVTYTPNANYNGSDSFSYTISDGKGGTATASVSITVTSVNDNPVANDVSVTTQEDTAVIVGILANISDADGDALTVSDVTTPGFGSAVINPDGTVTYTPDTDFNSTDSLDGTDVFTYTVSDGNGGTAAAVVIVTVIPVNDDPVAAADSATTLEEAAVTIDVLANDNDVDGDVITVTAVATATNGLVTLNPDNTITYTPDANFNGADTFSYTISDGNGGTGSATVTVAIGPVNDAPVAADDAATTPEDTAVTIPVLLNDSDIDGDALIVTAVTTPTNGLVVINPDNTITYTPAEDYYGPDSFSYTISDGSGDMATAVVIVMVAPVNDNPVAADDSAVTSENTAVTIDVLATDSDVDGDTLMVTAVTTATHGVVSINPDNTVTYTPDAGFYGSDSFSYTLSDGNGGSDTAIVTITVMAGNENPIAVDDSTTTLEDTAMAIDVLANDSDADGNPLTVTTVTAPANGTAVINPDNTVTYTPDANFYGSDSFSYTISDGAGGSDTAVVTITVTPVNDAPVANDDVATTLQDTTVTIDVLANDSDVEGDALSVTAVTIPTNGSVVINPDNTVTYTPDASYSSTDSFSYTASDGNGGSDTAVVTITVTPVANACELYPIALPEDLLEDLEIGDYLDDILNGNQPGNFGWLTWAGSTNVPTLVASLTPPGNSHTYINPYDPNDHALSIGDWVRGKPGVSNASSVRDALEVLKTMNIVVPVWDNTGGEGAHAKYHVSAFALIRLIDYHLPGRDNIEIQFLGYTSCTEENTNPVANNDSIITSGNTAVTIDVLTNDTDMDNDVLAVLEVTQPAYGTAVINPAPSTGSGQATITYTPNASFIGDDTFYYTVSDGRGGTDTAVITVTVTPVAGNCELYPIALHEDILDDLDVGDVVRNIKNGNRDGEFGWLTWTGDKSLSVLVESLTTPGDSYTYINPYHPNDNIVSIGDWVWGKPGLSNTCSISHALTELESMDIVVPVWDDAASQCGNLKYHVSGYATIRLLDYSLNGMDKINIQFLGYVSCGE